MQCYQIIIIIIIVLMENKLEQIQKKKKTMHYIKYWHVLPFQKFWNNNKLKKITKFRKQKPSLFESADKVERVT